MEVQAITIDRVFMKSRILQIPFFQRGYVWEDSNWQKFFDDIADIAMELQETGEAKDYFIGSIILKKQNARGPQKADVIDGQQRLTTIVMFYKALCLARDRNYLFKDLFFQRDDMDIENEPILIPNYNDKSVYNKIINLEFLQREPIAPNSKLADAFSYFANRIIEAHNDAETPLSLDKLNEAFMYYIRVVQIEVSENEDVQKIFETINCTGIKLTTGELLKNYLFEESSADNYERMWKPVFENNSQSFWEGNFVSGRLIGSHIENFFYRYMLIKIFQPEIKEKLSAIELKQYRQKDGLYEKFCNLMTKFNISKEDAVRDIVEYANLYMNTFKVNTSEDVAVAYPGIERLVYLMFLHDAWTMTPYILYILHTVDSENERNKIFHYMEIYLMRRIICKCRNNNYSDMFSENLIKSKVCTCEDFKNYVNDVDARGNLMMPSDEEVINAVCYNDLRKEVNLIYYMLESRMNHGFANSSLDNCSDAFFKEQIMPEKSSKNWTFDKKYSEEEHAVLTKTLGNYVMLREKPKGKSKNAAWTDKRLLIKDWTKELNTCQIFRNEVWTEKEIELRNSGLAKMIINCWPI